MNYTVSEIRKTMTELGNGGYNMGINGRNLNRHVCDRAVDMMNEMLRELERNKDEISRLKNEMSYMSDPLAIGDRHEMGAW